MKTLLVIGEAIFRFSLINIILHVFYPDIPNMSATEDASIFLMILWSVGYPIFTVHKK